MMKKIVTIITILLLGIPTYAESYVEALYTNYATTASAPTVSLPQMATTTMDDSPAYAVARDFTPPQDMADPNATPIGSPWPLLLFAVGYALHLRRRKLSANE